MLPSLYRNFVSKVPARSKPCFRKFSVQGLYQCILCSCTSVHHCWGCTCFSSYLDLTVADGTLNGLIFYANIVKIDQAIIFSASQTNVITVLLAWLNLDLGMEVCFFERFDAHTRTWLQYLFPVYI